MEDNGISCLELEIVSVGAINWQRFLFYIKGRSKGNIVNWSYRLAEIPVLYKGRTKYCQFCVIFFFVIVEVILFTISLMSQMYLLPG